VKASPRPAVFFCPDMRSRADEDVSAHTRTTECSPESLGLDEPQEDLAAYDAHLKSAESVGLILAAAREAQEAYRNMTARMWAVVSGALQENDLVRAPFGGIVAQFKTYAQSEDAAGARTIDGISAAIIRATEEAQREAGHEAGRLHQELSASREALRRGLAQQTKAKEQLAAEVRAVLSGNSFYAWQRCLDWPNRVVAPPDYIALADPVQEIRVEEELATFFESMSSALLLAASRVVRQFRHALSAVSQRMRSIALTAFWRLALRPPDIVYRQRPWFVTHGSHPPHLDVLSASL
jgi:hypothetical protein